MGSTIYLFFKNPNCWDEINLSRKGFKSKDAILAISSYTKLQREMGLKSVKVRGFSFLGIRAMKVEFREGKTLPSNLEYSTASRRSLPRMSKKARKNSTVQPFGQGILSRLKDLEACSTSSKVI